MPEKKKIELPYLYEMANMHPIPSFYIYLLNMLLYGEHEGPLFFFFFSFIFLKWIFRIKYYLKNIFYFN